MNGYWNGNIRTLQRKEELDALLDILKERKVKYLLEIGYYQGGTACSFDSVILEGKIISIDLFGVYNTRHFNNVHWLIVKDSKTPEAKMMVESIMTELIDDYQVHRKFDVIYIDGDHSYNGVKSDVANYKNMLAKGGIMVFDDICNREVRRAYEETIGGLEHKEIIIHDSTDSEDWNGIGIIYV